MKILILVGFLGCAIAHAQDAVTPEEWKREYNVSQVLAGKLFPDLTQAGTPLLHQYSVIANGMTSCPTIARNSFEPIYVAVLAAQSMGVVPKWDALSDSEKLEAFQELSYMSNRAILVVGEQQRYIAQVQNGGGVPNASFNPDALSGPARAIYAPSQDQSYNVIDSNGNSTVVHVSPGD